MNLLLDLAGLLIALAVLAAGFLYIFSPSRGINLLKRIGIFLLILLFLPSLFVQLLRAIDPVVLFLVFLLLCIAAYVALVQRARPRERQPRISAAERTPVLPREEDEQ